jgi:uncharacterized protein YcbX
MAWHISDLYYYPIKSCAGIAVEELIVGPRGPRHDRGWVVVDANGKFLSQRAYPRMALIGTHVRGETLTVEAPGEPSLSFPIAGSRDGSRLDVTVWKDAVNGQTESPQIDEWFSRVLGIPARLARIADGSARARTRANHEGAYEVGFADSAPFLLTSRASLEDLNRRMSEESPPLAPVPMNRFRPNLVVEGAAPYAEDEWREITVGDIRFPTLYACGRCTIITVDQRTAERGTEPLHLLTQYRRRGTEIPFGVRMIHRGAGVIRRGDAVRALK